MARIEPDGLSAEILNAAWRKAFGILHACRGVWHAANTIVTLRPTLAQCGLELAHGWRQVRKTLRKEPAFNGALRSVWMGPTVYECAGTHATSAHEWTMKFARLLLATMDNAALVALFRSGYLDPATVQKPDGMPEVAKRPFVLAYHRPWRRESVFEAIGEAVRLRMALVGGAVEVALELERSRALKAFGSNGLRVRDAALIAGVDDGVISQAASRGEIKDNGLTGRQRRLDYESVLAWKASRRDTQR